MLQIRRINGMHYSVVLVPLCCTKGQALRQAKPSLTRGYFRKPGAAILRDNVGIATPLAAKQIVAALPSLQMASGLPGSDYIMCLVTMAGAMGGIKIFDELARIYSLDKKLSRKLVHISIGLLFMLFWPLFSEHPGTRYLAALAPAANSVRMIGLGLGLWQNKTLVKALTREGDIRELLKGPLYYGMSITLVTLLFWRNSPIGAVTIANLCAGDGFADIVGRRFGNVKLPYNNQKSIIGSLAMFTMGFLASLLYVFLFSSLGYYHFSRNTIIHLLIVSFSTTLVESMPVSTLLDDNLTIPLTAVGVSMIVFHGS